MIIVALLILLAYAGFLFWFIKYRYVPRYYARVTGSKGNESNYRLARAVRRVLSFIHCFVFFLVIVWPVVYAVTAVSQTYHADINLYSGFKIDLSQLQNSEAPGLDSPQISGKTLLKVDSSSRFAWHLFALWTYIRALIALYIVLHLRNLFVSLGRGEAFDRLNTTRLKKIAIAILTLQVVTPLLQYFGWGAVVKGIALQTPVLRLYPAFELNPIGIFTGLALLVLSGVIREAAVIQDEQRLTI